MTRIFIFFGLFIALKGATQTASPILLTPALIDSICHSNEDDERFATQACGPDISKRTTYKDPGYDILLFRSGFLVDKNTNQEYLTSFSFYQNKLVKAVVSIQPLGGKPVYSATYYFNGQQILHVTGEDKKYSDPENIIRYATGNGGLWLPKNFH